MKKSYIAEILLIFSSAFGGAEICRGGWYTIDGVLLLFLSSYFLTSNLKMATINEYLRAVKKNKNGH